MAKRKNSVESDITAVFDHWAISDKAKQDLARQIQEREGQEQEPPVSPAEESPGVQQQKPDQPPSRNKRTQTRGKTDARASAPDPPLALPTLTRLRRKSRRTNGN